MPSTANVAGFGEIAEQLRRSTVLITSGFRRPRQRLRCDLVERRHHRHERARNPQFEAPRPAVGWP